LTEAEIAAEYITPHEITALKERLRTEEPPLSLDEARQSRANIKEERKASIDFIRSRTTSRAAQMGLPPTGICASVQTVTDTEVTTRSYDVFDG
jgi:short subunit dehydrogenase-like uncharacterized protein